MAEDGSSLIPVVDFSVWSLDRQDEPQEEEMAQLVQKVHKAFMDIGFVYLINTGIPQSQLDLVRNRMALFFSLPQETKSKYARPGDENHGYVAMEQESLNPERPGDLKQCYNVTPRTAKLWPDCDVPGFRTAMMEFRGHCCHLVDRILKLMAIGLGIQDKDFFCSTHNYDKKNLTSLRCLYYPPVPEKVKNGQIRCGEHSDYGSISLLFQDCIGGLEVQNRSGEYVPAPVLPSDGVLTNIGDLMQRWTADTYVSTKHRVVIPAEDKIRQSDRYSVVLFAHPDDDIIVTCTDGSNKYEPISSIDYLKMRFRVTY